MQPTDAQITALKLMGYTVRYNRNVEAWEICSRHNVIAIAYSERYFDTPPKELLWVIPYRYEANHMGVLKKLFGENCVI